MPRRKAKVIDLETERAKRRPSKVVVKPEDGGVTIVVERPETRREQRLRYFREYAKTPAGIERRRRYLASEKGRAAIKRANAIFIAKQKAEREARRCDSTRRASRTGS
jgi:hypothetical protein